MGLATVKVDIAPLYARPTAGSARTDEALYGMSVQVIQQDESGWCYLRTEHNTEGYTLSSMLELDAEVASAWRKYKKVSVLAPYIDVLAKPENMASCLVSVPRGGVLVSLGQPGIDGWQKVGLTAGAVGFTRASYLGEMITDWSVFSEEDLRWNIVETALSYNGTSYRAGGRSPLGIDAVGLVAMSYQLNGIVVPQDPFLRAGGALHEIDASRMQDGDILYFPSGSGIYIGDGRFVHATDYAGDEGVLVNSLHSRDDDYRSDLAGHILAVASVF